MPRILIFIGIIIGTLSGCSAGDKESVEGFIQRIKREKGGEIEKIPEVEQYEAYTYSSMDIKSPFEPSTGFLEHRGLLGREEEKSRPDAGRVREVLESFPLDSLSMVGIVQRGANIWGLITDKEGMIHRVRVGNYLGENSGKIIKLTRDTIFLREIVADGQGGWIERVTTLTMTE